MRTKNEVEQKFFPVEDTDDEGEDSESTDNSDEEVD